MSSTHVAAQAPPRYPRLTSLAPPAAPLVGVMAVTVGAAGTVPAMALDATAGLIAG